jgi:anti-sigma regulatory factor (Ser/Thr protein kinase)
MSLTKDKRASIKEFIINNVTGHESDIVKLTTDKFGITRQAINRYVIKLIEENILESTGDRNSIKYQLKTIKHIYELPVSTAMEEHVVWREKIVPVLPSLKDNVRNICQYGFTEMLNNAIFHSQTQKVTLSVEYNTLKINLWVVDDGIGIFNKIQKDFNLEDPKHAILELAKGKLTSDPQRHTGEGIFFTSRMFDEFSILSGGLYFARRKGTDWLIEQKASTEGTAIFMGINKDSSLNMKDVFDKFTGTDDGAGFSKTIVPVELMQYEGEALISRSQAKRLIARFEKFKEVVLDFKGIKTIGQAFADEVFRVFRQEHPETHLMPISTNEDVEKMIQHVLSQ